MTPTLKVFDLETHYDYRNVMDPYKLDTRLLAGPDMVGELIVVDSASLGEAPLKCAQDINKVVRQIHALGYQVGKTYHIAWSKVDMELLGKGIGKSLYMTALGYIASKAGGTRLPLLTADYCIGSTTTEAARRVYKSLLKDFLGHGLVMTPLALRRGIAFPGVPKPVKLRYD